MSEEAEIKKAAIIGAGSWGTAIAQILGSKGIPTCILARRTEVSDSINSRHINPRYLSDVTLSSNISSTCDITECVSDASMICIVTPSLILRKTAQRLTGLVSNDIPLILCSKGIEAETGNLGSEIFSQVLGNRDRIAVLSGPTHAEEVIKFIPSAAVIASTSDHVARRAQELFASPTFRTYTSDDVVGVELCGACKNIMAIATGMAYGMGFGDNTAAMIITRGLAEMSRLVMALGGKRITCMGLAGLGDLVVTCQSEHSRNRRLGFEIAQGKTLDDFHRETHMVAEGALACKTIQTLARKGNVEIPIADMVRAVLWEHADPHAAEKALLARPLKPEF